MNTALAIGVYIFIPGLVALVSLFLRAYVTKRAEGLATKQDIGAIVQTTEEIKSRFALLLESRRTESQMRLAVVERRFEVHQEAYTMWRRLRRSVHSDEESSEMIMACQEFWQTKGLYLDDKPRQAFLEAYGAVHTHRMLINQRERSEYILENMKLIEAAGPIIERAVSLPSLNNEEDTLADHLAEDTKP